MHFRLFNVNFIIFEYLLSLYSTCYQDSINIIFYEKVFNNVMNSVMKKKFIDNL